MKEGIKLYPFSSSSFTSLSYLLLLTTSLTVTDKQTDKKTDKDREHTTENKRKEREKDKTLPQPCPLQRLSALILTPHTRQKRLSNTETETFKPPTKHLSFL